MKQRGWELSAMSGRKHKYRVMFKHSLKSWLEILPRTVHLAWDRKAQFATQWDRMCHYQLSKCCGLCDQNGINGILRVLCVRIVRLQITIDLDVCRLWEQGIPFLCCVPSFAASFLGKHCCKEINGSDLQVSGRQRHAFITI